MAEGLALVELVALRLCADSRAAQTAVEPVKPSLINFQCGRILDVFPKTALSVRTSSQTPETTKPRIAGLRDMVPAPDERYVSARVGFSGIWSSLENSAYPN
jgi:hypothetical protein